MALKQTQLFLSKFVKICDHSMALGIYAQLKYQDLSFNHYDTVCIDFIKRTLR